ncbi:hypothetical protein PENSPDRAFT_690151 [Peniophora sp. CONT]|nr:hypothetical protein PENSPDRAFT_690151 [Peniophora sp. CONT]
MPSETTLTFSGRDKMKSFAASNGAKILATGPQLLVPRAKKAPESPALRRAEPPAPQPPRNAPPTHPESSAPPPPPASAATPPSRAPPTFSAPPPPPSPLALLPRPSAVTENEDVWTA